MPIVTLSTPEWYKSLATLIASAGTDAFPERLAETYQLISPYESTLIIGFTQRQRPLHLFNNLSSTESKASLDPYFAGAYLLDPFYALYKEHAATGIYRLKDIAPDEFYHSEYYQSYYAGTLLKDEAGILVEVNPDTHLLISLGIRDPAHSLSEEQWTALQTITPALTELCKQHWSANPIEHRQDDNTLGGPLDLAFNNFGREHLSDRECEVIQLILKGHSSKSIARLLEISPETVKVHRKRFHTKLEITSQAELFSLFLEAIAMVPMGSDRDPLSIYFEQTQAPL